MSLALVVGMDERSERRIRLGVRVLTEDTRRGRELLELLVSKPEVRANAIRQLHKHPETHDLAEILIVKAGRHPVR